MPFDEVCYQRIDVPSQMFKELEYVLRLVKTAQTRDEINEAFELLQNFRRIHLKERFGTEED